MFRLNKLTDYGIVLMAHVARSPQHAPHTARTLAKETRIPLPTVGKLLRQLHDAELLVSHRGAKGGYDLARVDSQISVSDIILALEGPIGFTECSVEPGACGMERRCAIMANSKIIGDALRTALDHVMLCDLNHELPHNERMGRGIISSIEPATAAVEGVR
jgi:FeS assembly SUF system regulator